MSKKILKSVQKWEEYSLKKAKILSFKTGEVLADLPSGKSSKTTKAPKPKRSSYEPLGPIGKMNDDTYKPLPDDFLNARTHLTDHELGHLENHIDYHASVIHRCDPDRDQDILDYHDGQLGRIEARLKDSHAKAKKKERMKKSLSPGQSYNDLKKEEELEKAKIFSFEKKKLVADLPTKETAKQAQPIVRDGEKGITNKEHIKQNWNPKIMPKDQKSDDGTK